MLVPSSVTLMLIPLLAWAPSFFSKSNKKGLNQVDTHSYYVVKIEVPKIPAVPTTDDPGYYTGQSGRAISVM